MSIAEIFETMDYGPAPESSGVAEAWLEQHGHTFKCFIGGKWTRSKNATSFETVNPANKQVLARITQGTAKDVDNAVAAANKAQAEWAALSGQARARYLYALARHIQKHSRLFAVLDTLDNGKPIRETRDIDIPLVARHFYHHAGWASLIAETFPDYVPVGVIGQVIPWNFPLLMLAWKVAPALAAGNTVVLKPAEFTPLTALLFADVCKEVGLPAGVFNVVTGDGRTGEALVNHADVNKIAFTGSTEVGKRIREQTAGSGKHLSLELGGKSPFIVFDDADLDSAVEGVVDAIWFNQGEVCCAGSRLLVQESVADTLTQKLRARLETLRIGSPLDKAIDIGAVVAAVQLERIESLVAQGISEGATCYQPSWNVPEGGYFYPPTLLTDVEPASTVAQVEIFGPVVTMMTFRTPVEAVELANNTRYGLAASVWSENLNLALDIAPKLKAGVVWVNSTNQFDAAAGFGGYRESGFGREGGKEGMTEYLTPAWLSHTPAEPNDVAPVTHSPLPGSSAEAGDPLAINRTAKLYIGGKQARPDGGYSYPVVNLDGTHIGDASDGNRKDIRNAVEAARKASGWSNATAHNRAQVMYYLAENLAARAGEFASRLAAMTGMKSKQAAKEVEVSLERLFYYAAWADKYDGAVHHTPVRNVTLAMPEPLGVLGLVCSDDAPLLQAISLIAPAIAMGNRVIIVPSARYPLAVTDLYQVLETSDVPAGVVNIVTGDSLSLTKTLAEHDNVDALWYIGSSAGSALVEKASASNLKQTWVNYGAPRDWLDGQQGQGELYLRKATQVKNIWVPYGE
ncbi:MAG: aldehyde dehydrogenase family protein [Deinococcota bacterium]